MSGVTGGQYAPFAGAIFADEVVGYPLPMSDWCIIVGWSKVRHQLRDWIACPMHQEADGAKKYDAECAIDQNDTVPQLLLPPSGPQHPSSLLEALISPQRSWAPLHFPRLGLLHC